MKSLLKFFLPALILLLSAGSALHGSEGEPADITADSILYDSAEDTVYARGSARVVYSGMDFTGDHIIYCRRSSVVEARGNIVFKMERYTVYASSMSYNLRSSTGTVYDTRITASPLYITAPKVLIAGTNEFLIPEGDLTTCDHQPPHYRFAGRNIRLKMDSRITAWNTVLYLRGAPSFYYPYFFRNLGPEKLRYSFDAGKSDSAGYYLKTRVSYPFTERSRTYAGVDLMSVKGAGFRLGHEYGHSGGRSEAEVYYINESDTGARRWRLFLKGWHRASGDLTLNYRTEYTSYREFGYDYDRESALYKQENLYYQFGADLSRTRYQASLYSDRMDIWEDGSYSIDRFILPGASLRLFPLALPGRVSFSGDTGYENRYEDDRGLWSSALNWRGIFRGSYRLDPGRRYYVSFFPSTGYDGRWEERGDLRHYARAGLGVRQGFYNRVFISNSYSWRRELQSPHETVTSILRNEVSVLPLRGLSINASASYNFLEGEPRPVGEILSSAEYRRGRNRFYLMNRYDYDEGETLEWLGEMYFAGLSETRLRYNYLYPERLELSQRFEFRIGDFQIMPGARMYFERQGGAYSFSEIIEQSLSAVWDMHCWQSNIRLVRRGDEVEMWFLVNILAFPERRVGIYGGRREDDDGDKHWDTRFHRE